MGIRMLTTIELAEILGMSPGTIANARVNGTLDIPFVKLNAKGVRYMESDVLAFIERRKVRSTAEADALNNAA